MKWEAQIDERGRILIPNEIRDDLKFRADQKFKIEILQNRKLVIQPLLDPEEFISEMKGCVSGGKIKSDKLKGIWGAGHTHD